MLSIRTSPTAVSVIFATLTGTSRSICAASCGGSPELTRNLLIAVYVTREEQRPNDKSGRLCRMFDAGVSHSVTGKDTWATDPLPEAHGFVTQSEGGVCMLRVCCPHYVV